VMAGLDLAGRAGGSAQAGQTFSLGHNFMVAGDPAFALKSGGGVYIHAERLLAKVGGAGARGGDLPPSKRSEAGVESAEQSGGLHKRGEEAWGDPSRARGAEPLSSFGCWYLHLSWISDAGVASGRGWSSWVVLWGA
jgi:hypothetical protein